MIFERMSSSTTQLRVPSFTVTLPFVLPALPFSLPLDLPAPLPADTLSQCALAAAAFLLLLAILRLLLAERIPLIEASAPPRLRKGDRPRCVIAGRLPPLAHRRCADARNRLHPCAPPPGCCCGRRGSAARCGSAARRPFSPFLAPLRWLCLFWEKGGRCPATG